MNVEELRLYALSKEDVTEGFPFGEDTLVLKTGNKMFLLISLDEPSLRFNAKCDPEKAIELREAYPEHILPGYHMSKVHWNTVIAKGLKNNFIKELIDDSYNLITASLKKKK